MTTSPDTTSSATAESVARVRRIFDGYTGLYAPSVIEEAARYLDDLLVVGERHGHTDPRSDAAGWLVQAAAEATSVKYRRPAQERTGAELAELRTALANAFTANGMEVTPARSPAGVAVAPIPPGPTWGYGDTGLSVVMFSDSGWDLTVNQFRSPAFGIYAPATAAGAVEVACLVYGVLTGAVPDPFRRP